MSIVSLAGQESHDWLQEVGQWTVGGVYDSVIGVIYIFTIDFSLQPVQ